MTTAGLTIEQVQKAVDAILEVLGEPSTDAQKNAIANFKEGNYDKVRRLAATSLDDYYCKSLGYLGSAFKLLPNTDTILAESARAAADHRERLLARQVRITLSSATQEYLENPPKEKYAKECIEKFVKELGKPVTELEEKALNFFYQGAVITTNNTAGYNLISKFCRILSMLSIASAGDSLDVFWLHEAANLIADYRASEIKRRNLEFMSIRIAVALG